MSRLVPEWVYPTPPPTPVDPRVIIDWTPLDLDDAIDIFGIIVNPTAWTGLTWTQPGAVGRWEIDYTAVPSATTSINTCPQIQFSPSVLLGRDLAPGEVLQISCEIESSVVVPSSGVGPGVGAVYGIPGSAGVGTITGNAYCPGLENSATGAVTSFVLRGGTSALFEGTFTLGGTNFAGCGMVWSVTGRESASGSGLSAFVAANAYGPTQDPVYYGGFGGVTSAEAATDLLITIPLYSRFALSSGTYRHYGLWKYRLLRPVELPS